VSTASNYQEVIATALPCLFATAMTERDYGSDATITNAVLPTSYVINQLRMVFSLPSISELSVMSGIYVQQ